MRSQTYLKSIAIWLTTLTVVFSVNTELFGGTIEFKDGQTYDIDYEILQTVWVDYQSPGIKTTLNFIEGGSANAGINSYADSRINIFNGGSGMSQGNLTAFERSVVTIWNGYAGYVLSAQDNSQVSFHDGVVGDLCAQSSSNVTFAGGLIERWFKAGDNSKVIVSGGNIDVGLESAGETQVTILGGIIGGLAETGFVSHDNSRISIFDGTLSRNLELQDDSIVTIYGGQIAGENDILVGTYSEGVNATLNLVGSGFTVDGQTIGYGELTSIMGGDCRDDPWRHLTGTLANGDLIDNDFKVGYDARIILTPEPATLLLFGLGVPIISRLGEGKGIRKK
jgi:hypothetical protein